MRGRRVAGVELSVEQAELGAVSGGRRPGIAAWPLWATVEPGVHGRVPGGRVETGADAVRGFRADAGRRAPGQRAHAALARADYHRRRPTARQLDEIFWLEEERVLSEDWVVRYQNRLLQLERPSRPRVPAKSRVLVRENQAGEVAIHYRDHSLVFREWKAASTARSEGRGVAPSLAPPSPKPKSCIPAADHPWRRNRYQQMKTTIFSTAW